MLALQLAAVGALVMWFFLYRSSARAAVDHHTDPKKVRIGAAVYALLYVLALSIPMATAFLLVGWEDDIRIGGVIAGLAFLPALAIVRSDYLYRTPIIGSYLLTYSIAASRHDLVKTQEEVEKLEKLAREYGV